MPPVVSHVVKEPDVVSPPVEAVVPSVVDVEVPLVDVVESVVAVELVETPSLVKAVAPLVETPSLVKAVEPFVDVSSVIDELDAEFEDVDVVGAGSLLITPLVDELSTDAAQWLPDRGVAPGGHSVADGATQPTDKTSGTMKARGGKTCGMAGNSLSSSRG